MGLLFELCDERPCPLQGRVEIIDTEKQEEAVTGRSVFGTHQGRMIVCAPPVKAEQDRAIRVDNLAPVVMTRSRLWLAEQRLIPFEAPGHVLYTDNRPYAFHEIPPATQQRIASSSPGFVKRAVSNSI